MRQRVYRWLIAILGAWGLLSLPSLLAMVPAAIQSGDINSDNVLNIIVPTLGFALLPIAVVGLWNFRLWGFICLFLGFLLVVATHANAVFLHATCIGVTLVRYFFQQQDLDTGQENAN